MTEQEYQTGVRQLMRDAEPRLDVLVDYLVTQPPKRLAMQEARAFCRWAMEQGANHPYLVQERAGRIARR